MTTKNDSILVHKKYNNKEIQNLIKELCHSFATLKDYELYFKVHSILQKQINLEHFEPYAMFDSKKDYTRNLIFESNEFSLILLCWNPNRGSCIHAHSGSRCWLKCIHGLLNENLYAGHPSGKEYFSMPTRVIELKPGSIAYMDDSIGVHSVQNPTNMPAMSLHIYSPPIRKCKYYCAETGEELTAECSYYSEYGTKKIYETPQMCKKNCSVHVPVSIMDMATKSLCK